jgi:sugar fermentation stimulation protein A
VLFNTAGRNGFQLMELFSRLEKAAFIDRPNRFLVRCRVGKRTVLAHMPNPGRMWELLLPGAVLYIQQHDAQPDRRTTFSVVAVEREHMPVLLHTQRTNDVARHLIDTGQVPALRGWHVAQQEYTVGRSRFDFLLEGPQGSMMLEVKSCTLFSHGLAMFPDAITERGRRHLEHLASLADQGTATGVLFVVHYPQVTHFMPDYHTDPAFARTFLNVRDRVKLMAVATGWDHKLRLQPGSVRPLEIPWQLIGQQAIDSGVYIIVLRLTGSSTFGVGALGAVTFKKGWYLYVGSAQKNLQARMQRHRRLEKKLFWHIDYLRQKAEFCASLPVRGTLVSECGLAAAVAAVAHWQVPSFGCSDCACPSHLFGMPGNPLEEPAFIDMLLALRMGRLAPLLHSPGEGGDEI